MSRDVVHGAQPRVLRRRREQSSNREDRNDHGERQQQQQSQPEVGHRVPDERQAEGSDVEAAPAPPRPPDADVDAEHREDHGGRPEQQHGGPEPLGDLLRDRHPVGVRDAEVPPHRVPDVGDELLREQGLVEPEVGAELLHGLRRQQLVPGQDPCRVAGQDAEQEEVEADDEDQGEERLPALLQQVPSRSHP
jgi:hypothetical protein